MMFIRRDLVLGDMHRFALSMKERYHLSHIELYQTPDFIGYTFERVGDPSEYVMVQEVKFDERGDIALVNKMWTLFQNGNVSAEGLPSIGHVFDLFKVEREHP